MELLDISQKLVTDKVKVLKEAYLSLAAEAGMVEEVRKMVSTMDTLINDEFKNFCYAIKYGRQMTISKPTVFELELSDLMLRQAKYLFEILAECEEGQDQLKSASVFDVLNGLLTYYKNVTCLVYEVEEKFKTMKQDLVRRKKHIDTMIEEKLASSKKESYVYDRLFEIQALSEKMKKRLDLLAARAKRINKLV